jgi:hypothetical protein
MSPQLWIDKFTTQKKDWEEISYEEQKTYNQFIINLFLSMIPEYIEIINQVQLTQVSDKHHYNFFKQILPKRKPWFKWVKGKKKTYSNKVIDIISDYYQVGRKDILDSLEIMDEKLIKNVLSKAGIQDKEITKLLK